MGNLDPPTGRRKGSGKKDYLESASRSPRETEKDQEGRARDQRASGKENW